MEKINWNEQLAFMVPVLVHEADSRRWWDAFGEQRIVSKPELEGFAVEGGYYPVNGTYRLRVVRWTGQRWEMLDMDHSTYQPVVEKLPADKARELATRWIETAKAGDIRTHLSVRSKTVKIGADPEFFVVRMGELVPAFTFLPRKADAPEDGGQVFWDGFQGEFTVPPETCLQLHAGAVRMQLNRGLEAARKAYPDAKLTIKNVFAVDEKWFAEEVNPEYLALGCAPSKNIYGAKGALVENGRAVPYRFAGYHMHFSPINNTPWTPDVKREAVRMLDAVAGIAAVSLAASIDNPIRRKYYGLAGEVRWPEYGIEWRTPSNFLLCHPAIHHLFWNLSRRALEAGIKHLRPIYNASDEQVQDVINGCDVKEARKLIEKHKALYMFLFEREYNSIPGPAVELAYDTVLNGVERVVKDPDDIENNWGLLNDEAWRKGAYQWSEMVRQTRWNGLV